MSMKELKEKKDILWNLAFLALFSGKRFLTGEIISRKKSILDKIYQYNPPPPTEKARNILPIIDSFKIESKMSFPKHLYL